MGLKSIASSNPNRRRFSPTHIGRNRKYLAIAIENERDEDLCVIDGGKDFRIENDDDEDLCETLGGVAGGLPQLPAGFLVIVELVGWPAHWSTRDVDLTGVDVRFTDDPEPEFVDIDKRNRAAVTLQENNGMVVVDLSTGTVPQSPASRDFCNTTGIRAYSP